MTKYPLQEMSEYNEVPQKNKTLRYGQWYMIKLESFKHLDISTFSNATKYYQFMLTW